MANSEPITGFYASRPTIKVDGTRQAALGDVLLISMLVEETTLGLFRCEAHFGNWGPKDDRADFLLFDRQTIDFGKEFSVAFGAPGAQMEIFKGRITGIEAQYPPARPPELTVLAEDRFQDLRMERRTRSFENVSDADVIRQLASQHGLTPQVDVDGPVYRVLTQVNQSDLAFLRERAAAVDAELWVEDRTLHAQARSRRSAGNLTVTYGRNLLEFAVVADLAHQRTSVRVSGWDVGSKSAIDEEAGEGIISAELNGGRSGSAVLGQALAARKERVVSSVPLSQTEARALAEARYRTRARRFVHGRGQADGTPSIRVGTTLDVQGLGDLFNGKYYVVLARHTFDLQQGYRTFLKSNDRASEAEDKSVLEVLEQIEEAAARKRLYGAYPSTVTDIKDPDAQGRVKVKLPWMPDNDGGGYEVWARLAVLMAGASRGTWFIPDVGDEVLVVFEGGDARRPYVVGALWNGRDTPPEQMDGAGNNYKKSIVSRRDIRITFDDQEGQETLTLKTPQQQSIEIKDGGRSIEIKDANGNTIKLDPAGITITAAAQVKVQASTVEVSAGMVTVNAGMSKFSGVVQCDTLISNAVVSASYTPGAGNIW